MTVGFDRTFGPAYYYFNHGSPSSTIAELRQDAVGHASPTWDITFYETVAPYFPGFFPPSKSGTFKGQISIPVKAKNAIVILSTDGMDVQDNAANPNGCQYWSAIGPDDEVEIPLIVP
jgi:rhamnogalacturonan endolyase